MLPPLVSVAPLKSTVRAYIAPANETSHVVMLAKPYAEKFSGGKSISHLSFHALRTRWGETPRSVIPSFDTETLQRLNRAMADERQIFEACGKALLLDNDSAPHGTHPRARIVLGTLQSPDKAFMRYMNSSPLTTGVLDQAFLNAL